jgi:citronellol/citronellal dehydrogenase
MTSDIKSPTSSIFLPSSFDGAVVLVTGGGTGIGRTIALELASLGATVIICGRTSSTLASVCNGATNIHAELLNIRDRPQCYRVIAKIIKDFGKITHLVNNAGGQFYSPAEFISGNGFDSVVSLNLIGTWNVTKAVFDLWMRDNGGGAVVSILMNMKNGYPGMAHSGAARAGVENLTKSLAVEWGSSYNIRLNCVAPGTIKGSGLQKYPSEVKNELLKVHWQNPIGRLGNENEISAPVVFLLSKAASYITGTTLYVDGGSSLAYDAHFYKEQDKEILSNTSLSPTKQRESKL